MAQQGNVTVAPADGKLGVLIPGMGAVTTTFIAGVEAVKQGLGAPIGSLTQLGTIRLGKRTEGRTPKIKDFVPLAPLECLSFGGWDIYEDNAYEAATRAQVLERPLLDQLKEPLSAIRPMKAVFDHEYVKRINGPNVKSGASKMDKAEALMEDIRDFKKKNGCTRLVMIWCGSTEVFHKPAAVHQSLEAFRRRTAQERSGYCAEPDLRLCRAEAARSVRQWRAEPDHRHPGAARAGPQPGSPDLRQGFQDRPDVHEDANGARFQGANARCSGWFSTNILGNRDGEVLEDPGSFKTKEETKLSVLEQILQPNLYPDLYKDLYHKVRINYYPPRGDAKEGWDNIDIFGWLGYPMQIKIDFLCRDSILAAPLVLDLVLFLDLAQRAGMKGIQEWLSFYFKAPMTAPGLYPEHDIFIQLMKLKNTLRWMRGEDLITHLGLEYYD